LQTSDRDQDGLTAIRSAIVDGKSSRVVLRNYRKDGSLFWNELSISPIYNDDDQLTYYIGIQKDVTAQVEFEERALKAERALADLQAAQQAGQN
jgi:PAS domain S-box-containing protein